MPKFEEVRNLIDILHQENRITDTEYNTLRDCVDEAEAETAYDEDEERFRVKYFVNGVELKNGMKIVCEISTPLGTFQKEMPVVIKFNKLYVEWGENDLREVDDVFYKPIRAVQSN